MKALGVYVRGQESDFTCRPTRDPGWINSLRPSLSLYHSEHPLYLDHPGDRDPVDKGRYIGRAVTEGRGLHNPSLSH